MTKEQFERERKYQIRMLIARGLLEKGLISGAELTRIECRMHDKYQPLIGSRPKETVD